MSAAATVSGATATGATVWAVIEFQASPVIGPESLLPASIAAAGVIAAASLSWRARGMWSDLVRDRDRDRTKIEHLETKLLEQGMYANKELDEIHKQLDKLLDRIDER